jgi:3-oxoacyl-[acyl-carrier-protein] synthase-3
MTGPAPGKAHGRRAAIEAIATAFPALLLTNDALLDGAPPAQRDVLVQRIGVSQRHVAAEGETALDLGERACRNLFAQHPELPAQLDTLIFCTQSPDYLLPPNSCVLHGRLGLPESVAAFDIAHACSGYVYGVQQAQALIASGMAGHVLLVNADTYTKFIHPQDRSMRVLIGDAAAATWFARADDGRGVCDVLCGTSGQHHGAFIIPAGGCRQPLTDALRGQEESDASGNVRSPAHIHMAGRDILSFVADRIPAHVQALLRRNGLDVQAVDWFVFHQASNVVLDTLIALLELDPARAPRHLDGVGNTVSASIPLTLQHALLEAGRVRPGQWVVLCGFGVGLSWGSVLLRW